MPGFPEIWYLPAKSIHRARSIFHTFWDALIAKEIQL